MRVWVTWVGRWAAVVAMAAAGVVQDAAGGIPEPDVVLYGQVMVGGEAATAADDVVVVARLDGLASPLASYVLGSDPAAGDDYILRLPVQSPVGGPVTGAAMVGQVVHLRIRVDGGAETPASDYLISAAGAFQRLDLEAACDSVGPVLVHGGAAPPPGAPRSVPCTGYIDPRVEITIPGGQPAGLTSVVLVFSEPVRDLGSGAGGTLTAAAFAVSQTGGGVPPAVAGISQSVDPGGRHVVTLTLSAPPQPERWTTIRAAVEDLCANPIADLGNLGPGVSEPDRLDIGVLPCDIDQSGLVGPVDFLRFRQFLFNTCGSACPSCDSSTFYYDMDRDGLINALDVLRFRQWVFGTGAAARPWNGAALPPRP